MGGQYAGARAVRGCVAGLAIVVLVTSVLLGCSSARNKRGQGCVEGLVQRCACDTGMGIQVCQIDGTFGACACEAVVSCPSSGCGTAGAPAVDAGKKPKADAGMTTKPDKKQDAGVLMRDAGTKRDAGRPDSGMPIQPSCTNGTQRCNANMVEMCAGGAYSAVRNCGQLVCAVEGTVASCHESCAPGAAMCMGAKLRVCRTDGLGFTEKTCDTANGFYCDMANASCALGCVPGSAKCNGAASMVCKSDATGYDAAQRCMGATPGCSPATGRCGLACATGTIEETFSKGMVGCAQQVAHDSMLTQRCSYGFHVCSATEWVDDSGGKKPTSDYWFAESIHMYDGSDGNCSIASGNQSLGGSFKICTKDVGACTTLSGCGYQTTNDQSFGYSARDDQAGALCCPDP